MLEVPFACISSIDNIQFDKNQYVCRFMKGIFNKDPPQPTYDVILDEDNGKIQGAFYKNFTLKNTPCCSHRKYRMSR